MADHDEVYGHNREAHLVALLRHLAERIHALDREGRLLHGAPELQRLLGDARSELFHYEVRSTYDTPEVADNRRIVEEALRNTFNPEETEDDDPWRPPPAD